MTRTILIVAFVVSAVATVVFALNSADIFTFDHWAALGSRYPIPIIFFVSLLGIIFFDIWMMKELGEQDPTIRKKKIRNGERTGHFISTFESNFYLRPLLSLQAAYFISGLLFSLDILTGSFIFSWWAALILMALLAIIFALNDSEPVEVANAHVAIVTFLGRRFTWYLEEGKHYWYGGKIGFDVSREPLPEARDGTPEKTKGQVFIGNRVLDIWGARGAEAEEENGKRQLIHRVVASDKSIVKTTLTITIRTEDPLTWANSQNPILDAAERSRAAFRSHVDLFTGFDNVDLKDVATELMNGRQLLAAFTAKPVGIYPKGSVLRNRSGRPIYEVFDPFEFDGEDGEEEAAEEAHNAYVSELEEDLLKRMREQGDPAMLRVIAKDKNKEILQKLGVQRNLVETMDAIGAYFDHASVGSITLSKEVEDQANIAAGENLQLVAQEKSAQTAKIVRDILLEGLDTPESEVALMAALAKDGHAEIIHVSGADRLTKAAVAGGRSIGGKK